MDVKLGSEELIVPGFVLCCFCRQRSKTRGDKLSSYVQDWLNEQWERFERSMRGKGWCSNGFKHFHKNNVHLKERIISTLVWKPRHSRTAFLGQTQRNHVFLPNTNRTFLDYVQIWKKTPFFTSFLSLMSQKSQFLNCASIVGDRCTQDRCTERGSQLVIIFRCPWLSCGMEWWYMSFCAMSINNSHNLLGTREARDSWVENITSHDHTCFPKALWFLTRYKARIST